MSRGRESVNMRKFSSNVSGTYRTPYKSQGLFKVLVLCAFTIIGIFILLITAKFVRDHFSHDASDSLMLIASAIVLLLAEAIVVLLAAVVTKSVCSGYKCTYIDDGERFVTNEGGNHREVYYWEIKDIVFEQITTLGKVRGYEVTVITEHRKEVYRVVSDGFLSKESTPFHLMSERVDQYQAKKAHEAYLKEMRSINSAAISLGSDSQSTDPANRLGMDAEMPTVGLPKSN